jgi:hypothetical protein
MLEHIAWFCKSFFVESFVLPSIISKRNDSTFQCFFYYTINKDESKYVYPDSLIPYPKRPMVRSSQVFQILGLIILTEENDAKRAVLKQVYLLKYSMYMYFAKNYAFRTRLDLLPIYCHVNLNVELNRM